MEEPNQEKIIDKIKKLLQLSKNNSNLNEASNAYAQAQALLTKYRLDMLELERSNNHQENFTKGSPLFSGKRVITWKSILVNGLSKLNGCKSVILHPNNRIEMTLFGRKTDIEIVEYLFWSIVFQIEYFYKEALDKNVGSGKTFGNSFKVAAVQTVIQRLKQSQEEIIKESKTSTALVKNDDKAVEAFVEKIIGKLISHKHTLNNVDDMGKMLGIQAGNRIELNKGLKQ